MQEFISNKTRFQLFKVQKKAFPLFHPVDKILFQIFIDLNWKFDKLKFWTRSKCIFWWAGGTRNFDFMLVQCYFSTTTDMTVTLKIRLNWDVTYCILSLIKQKFNYVNFSNQSNTNTDSELISDISYLRI